MPSQSVVEANITKLIRLATVVFLILSSALFAHNAHSEDASLVFSKAKSAFDKHEYEKAQKLFEMGLQIDSKNALAFYYYALSLKAQYAPYQDVMGALKKAVQLGGSSQVAADAMEKIADLQIEEKRKTEQAEEDKKQAAKDAQEEQEDESATTAVKALLNAVSSKCFCTSFTHPEPIDDDGSSKWQDQTITTCLIPKVIEFEPQDLASSQPVTGQTTASVRTELFNGTQKVGRISFEYTDSNSSIWIPPRVQLSLRDNKGIAA